MIPRVGDGRSSSNRGYFGGARLAVAILLIGFALMGWSDTKNGGLFLALGSFLLIFIAQLHGDLMCGEGIMKLYHAYSSFLLMLIQCRRIRNAQAALTCVKSFDLL